MKKALLIIVTSLLFEHLVNSADVYEIQVAKESHKFTIDAATFSGIDFSQDRFSPLYGSGEITFDLTGKKNKLKFDLTKDSLYQVWHDKTEMRLLFHLESSFEFDKVHGDDVTLCIIATSKDGKTYKGNYSLELDQYGLKNQVKLSGEIEFKRAFRYHP